MLSLSGAHPDLHIGVVSSSMGAGRFTDVPGCGPASPGNHDGRFMPSARCAALAPGQTFLVVDGAVTNFSGPLADTFTCLADVGSGGCMFSQPLAATLRALEKAADPFDPDNGGFLRDDAYLFVVIVTSRDDCSVPATSDLFDPVHASFTARHGQLDPYRCVEFGYLCDGQPPPRVLPDGAVSTRLESCVPAEDAGALTAVGAFQSALLRLKPPERIIVAASAGLPSDAVASIDSIVVDATPGGQPTIEPACKGPAGGPAAPAIRIKSWLDGFPGSVLGSVCGPGATLVPLLTPLAWHGEAAGHCLPDAIDKRADGIPDCQVVRSARYENTASSAVRAPVPFCNAHLTNFPCWTINDSAQRCATQPEFRMCHDPTCSLDGPTTPDAESVDVSCALAPPCR